jgi:hydrogenase expression/formation protein HypE
MDVSREKDYVRPVDFKHGKVELSHGSGGKAMAQLIDQLFLRVFDNPWLRELNDQARLDVPPGRLALATDSHVVTPLFFPGGDIGSLAVHGTLNDVAMSGARPLFLSAAFIIEEGFALADLRRVAESMADASRAAAVPVVTGDTKVVERGKGDGLFVTTTAIGVIPEGVDIAAEKACPGDRILVSGTVGDHGVAVMSHRESLGFATALESDSCALHGLVAAVVEVAPGVHSLRDPTRGGLASALNEIAVKSDTGMLIREADIPVRPEVEAACELLGLDPLYVACEGRVLVICAREDSPAVLGAMKAHPLGHGAADIGEVRADAQHFVEMETVIGGRRMVDWLSGEQLPRIC